VPLSSSRRRAAGAGPLAEPTTGPNGLIEAAGHQRTVDLFNIDEQTLNTPGPADHDDNRAEGAAGRGGGGIEVPGRPGLDMRTAIVSIDPKTGAVKAYYGGSDANGFDFAQAGLPTGSSVQGVRFGGRAATRPWPGIQVDSSP